MNNDFSKDWERYLLHFIKNGYVISNHVGLDELSYIKDVYIPTLNLALPQVCCFKVNQITICNEQSLSFTNSCEFKGYDLNKYANYLYEILLHVCPNWGEPVIYVYKDLIACIREKEYNNIKYRIHYGESNKKNPFKTFMELHPLV